MEQLALWVYNIDPWWLIAAAIVALILEVYLQTQVLMTISIALIIPIILNFLNVNHFVQFWFIPISLFVAYFIQRKIFELTSKAKIPYFVKLEDMIGNTGIMRVKEINEQYSEDYFYAYKEKNKFDNIELSQENPVTKLYKLEVANGRVYPVKNLDNEVFNDGEEVKIIKVINGSFVVNKLNKE